MKHDLAKIFDAIGNGSESIALLQKNLSAILRDFYNTDFRIGLSIPWKTDDGCEYLIFDPSDESYHITRIDMLSISGRDDVLEILFSDLDLSTPCKPAIVLLANEAMNQSDRIDAQSIATAYVRSTLANINKSLRRAVVHSKVKSNDLGSFMHRLINEEKINSYFSCDYISIFVRDWIGEILQLRGTNAKLQNEQKKSDIKFHATDKTKKLVNCHLLGEPIFEFSKNSNLMQNGQSHEETSNGTWSRMYWPIRLTQETESTLSHKPDRTNDGVIRLTNCTSHNLSKIPFTWLHLSALEFFSETLFIIVDAFSSADEASFKKDEAFHNSMSVVDTIVRNIESFSDSIHDPMREANKDRPRRFKLEPLADNKHIPAERILRLLRTAYASAKDIGFQIARANDEIPYDPGDVTDSLLRDVLIRAIELVPDMCTAHSAVDGLRIPTFGDIIPSNDQYPPPVRGAPEALVSVFANIFENSVKYRKPGERVNITVEVEDVGKFIHVHVRDKGVGVEGAELEKIFNRGWRGKNAQFAPRGSGLGLSWSESVLKTFGGSIKAVRLTDGLEVVVSLEKVT
ncbi:MAG: ATP-binding protein [Sphingomonadaceae bacterium]|nr:ATP-binding protein [Sphingomonadaceae bacterium]